MSLKRSSVSSKLLMCIKFVNCKFNVSGTNHTDTRACSQSSDDRVLLKMYPAELK